jgi:hypothetical protein
LVLPDHQDKLLFPSESSWPVVSTYWWPLGLMSFYLLPYFHMCLIASEADFNLWAPLWEQFFAQRG